MKNTFVCFVFAGLVVFPQHSNSLQRRSEPKFQESNLGIYDSKTTTVDKYPYMVAILENDNFICAGAIVNYTWIITVAGCLLNSQVSDLKVLTGSNDTVNGAVYDVVQVVNHTDYDSATYDYNYALVEINDVLIWSSLVQPVTLPSSKLCAFSSVTVVGYGQTKSSSSSGSSQLREGTMKWWPNLLCKSFYGTEDITLTDRMVCAYNTAKTTLCTGDIADPFVKDGVLYGLFFYSPTMGFCTSSASPVILVNIYPVTDWIRNIIGSSYDQQ